jgi:hypothetical protein
MEELMKNVIKQLTLVVVIAMTAASAQAGIKDTVVGYWNSACTKTSNAAQAVKAMPKSVYNWCAGNYFFATNLHKLPAILNKLDNYDQISSAECEIARNAIIHSTLPEAQRNAHGDALTQYLNKNENSEAIVAAREALINIRKQQLFKLGAYTAATVASMAALYAYKRYTAKPSVRGWC